MSGDNSHAALNELSHMPLLTELENAYTGVRAIDMALLSELRLLPPTLSLA